VCQKKFSNFLNRLVGRVDFNPARFGCTLPNTSIQPVLIDKASPVTQRSINRNVMFLARGEDWRRMRAILSPAFTTGKLKQVKLPLALLQLEQ
jgi:cytochrome P450